MRQSPDESGQDDPRSVWMATRGREVHLAAVEFLIQRLTEPTGIREVDAVAGVDPAKVVPGAALEADLGLDSLGVVELLMALEDRFGFTVSEEEAGRLFTVSDLADLVVCKKAAEETADGTAG